MPNHFFLKAFRPIKINIFIGGKMIRHFPIFRYTALQAWNSAKEQSRHQAMPCSDLSAEDSPVRFPDMQVSSWRLLTDKISETLRLRQRTLLFPKTKTSR